MSVIRVSPTHRRGNEPLPVRTLRRASWSGLLVTALLVLGLSPSAAAATDYYVDRTDPGCSDTGAGTATDPFCTVSKGVSKLVAGSVLYVGDGTYRETIKPSANGTSTAPITITAWPGRSPVIGDGVTNGAYVSTRSHVILSGLHFAGSLEEAVYVTKSNNIVVSGNTVTSAGRQVSGDTAGGISVRNSTDSRVTGNRVSGTTEAGIYVTGRSTRVTVSHNDSSHNAAGVARLGIGIYVNSPGNTVLGNVTHDNEDSGIQVTSGGDNTLLTLNVTYNNGDHGIDNLNANGGRVIGNTVYRNCTSGINVEGTSGNYLVVNNVAVDNAVYPAYDGISCARRGGNIGIWDSAPATTTVDHNLVWLTRSGAMYSFDGVSYSSLQAFQAATGQEAHGVEADPRFLDPAVWDLRIGAGSAAIDRADSGVNGEQAVDVLGAPRVDDPSTPNTWAAGPRPYDDLGAYEFQPPPAPPPGEDAPPTAALSVSPSTGEAPVQVVADASASSDPEGEALSYTFDFGDGTQAGPQAAPTATHTYTSVGTYTVVVTVTDAAGLTSTAQQSVVVNEPAPAPPPAYVSQIATNYSTATKTDGYITVWRAAGVQAGNVVVLSLQLGATAPTGPVTGTDTAGNTYTTASSVSDASGNRLVVLSGVASNALAAGDRINVTFPAATGYRLTGDEISGATAVDRVAAASGSSTAFSSGPTPTTTVPGELVFGAVSVTGGTTHPTWDAGWSSVGSHAVGTSYLARAQQVTSTTGSFAATGTASGPWLATVVTFRP